MDLHLQPDWQRALGQYVEIRLGGKTVRESSDNVDTGAMQRLTRTPTRGIIVSSDGGVPIEAVTDRAFPRL